MQSCDTFEQLMSVCYGVHEAMPALNIDEICNVRLTKDAKCEVTVHEIAEDCPILNPYPIRSSPDLSCFAHAASRICYGNEYNHIEMRCRIVVEGVTHDKHYKQENILASGMAAPPTSKIKDLYANLSGAYDWQNTKEDVDLVYNRDIFDYRKPNAEASQWQMHQFASVLGCSIYSLYPSFPAQAAGVRGHVGMREAYNRIITPRQSMQVSGNPYAAIQWTMSTPSLNIPNHFVAVVP